MNPTQINKYVVMTTPASNIVKHSTQHPQQRLLYNATARRLTARLHASQRVSSGLGYRPTREEMHARQCLSPKKVGRANCLPTSSVRVL